MLLEIESLGQIYSPLQDIKDLPASPSPRPRLQDLKVEVPLSPPHSDQTPPWKKRGVPFSEAISELVPELSLPLPNPENNSSQDIDAFFEETIKPIAAEAERSIEQEQLQEADTTLRVTMPVMDFSLPVAPWKPRSQQPPAIDEEAIYMRTLTEMKALHFNKHIWPMSGPAERELKWTPFPAALGKVETQESIPDNGVIDRYMVPPDRVDIETLTWKSDGLRILDGLTGSDEGDLQEGSFPEEKDIISLVRKRKFELEAREDSPSVSTRNYFAEKARPSNKQITSTDSRESKTITRPGMGNVKKVQSHQMSFSNGFFAMGALEDYMSVRKGELVRPELKISNYFPSTSSTEQTNTTVQADLPNLTSHASAQASRPAIPSFPSPNFQTPSSSHHFIVSVSFLSNRPLSRQVQRLFPSAEFIERDFMLYASLHETCQDRRATSRSAVACIPAVMAMDEADMILSPSTGLIWTTLQKVKQRSLPGQQAKSAIQKRILRICPRYERLIVVISQDQKMADLTDVGACDFDHSDCEAFAEFIAFCATLQNSEVQPLFVAGGVDELARWIVALMVKHGFSDQDGIKLLLDETLWEIFLRRAGMNAYAAQAILGTLKAPDQSTDEVSDMGRLQGADFGLGAFVMMSAEERQKRFETLLGGRRLLETVSKILDTRW